MCNINLRKALLGRCTLLSGGVGYLAGWTINKCDRFLHPVKSALGKPPLVNPLHGVICGIAFAIIDRLSEYFIQRYFPENIKNKPITHALRVIVSISLAALAISTALSISASMAAVLIATNILATTLLFSITDYYSKLAYKGGALPAADKKPDAPKPRSSDILESHPRVAVR